MAFADTYGYKTNVGSVVAFAEGDEYGVDAEGAVVDAGDQSAEYDAVDLVLSGQSSGGARRKRVEVATDEDSAEVNQAWPAVSDRYTTA